MKTTALLFVFFTLFSSVSHGDRITIKTSQKEIAVEAEIPKNLNELAKGLMFRTSMGENESMLFLWEREDRHCMWMKNTYLSLDMLFIDKNGVIVKIIENTIPLSLTELCGGFNVKSVLEVNAGFAKKHDIKVGDKVIAPQFF